VTVDGRRIRSRRVMDPDHALAEDVRRPHDLGSSGEVVGLSVFVCVRSVRERIRSLDEMG